MGGHNPQGQVAPFLSVLSQETSFRRKNLLLGLTGEKNLEHFLLRADSGHYVGFHDMERSDRAFVMVFEALKGVGSG